MQEDLDAIWRKLEWLEGRNDNRADEIHELRNELYRLKDQVANLEYHVEDLKSIIRSIRGY